MARPNSYQDEAVGRLGTWGRYCMSDTIGMVRADGQFEPVSENGPSSSVTDLFDSFRSASDFLMDLNWPDEYQLAAFATRLARVCPSPACCPMTDHADL